MFKHLLKIKQQINFTQLYTIIQILVQIHLKIRITKSRNEYINNFTKFV